MLASCGEDGTLFFFKVTEGTSIEPAFFTKVSILKTHAGCNLRPKAQALLSVFSLCFQLEASQPALVVFALVNSCASNISNKCSALIVVALLMP